MEITDRIALCKQCLHKSFNPSKGIVCGLSNEKPTFDSACKNFLRDENIKEREPARLGESANEGRGGCLSTILVLIIVGALFNILISFAMIASKPRMIIETMPVYFYLINALSGMLALSGAVLMFLWRKLGVYIYGGALLISIINQVQRPYYETIHLIAVIFGIIILFAVIAPKWDDFK